LIGTTPGSSGVTSILAGMSVGPAARLDLGPAPRSDASTELAALLAQGRALRDRVDDIDRQQREATERAATASAALAQLERRGLAGEDVGSQRKKLEAELAKAKATAAEPWAERRAGGQAAVRDHEQQVVLYVGQHFAELYGDLAEDAEAAAARIDAACNELLAAYHERMLVEGRVTTLAAIIRQPRPGDVGRTRAEAVAAAASALLQEGGEAAPLLRDDPRQAAPVQPPAEGEPEEREPEPATAA
jgi:hypothetical protein